MKFEQLNFKSQFQRLKIAKTSSRKKKKKAARLTD